jgi:hypothetical protein
VSAAGDALQMLPPSVPRFWLAMEPVQDADLDKQRKVGGNFFAAANVGKRSSCADGYRISSDADETQLAQMIDREQRFLREAAGVERDHDLSSAGDGRVLAGLSGELLPARPQAWAVRRERIGRRLNAWLASLRSA